MHTPTDPRQQTALDAAMNQIKATAATVAERVADTLGLMSRSATRISERDLMNSAQFELRRNMGPFLLALRDTLRERIDRELRPTEEVKRGLAATDWHTLTLVEDDEMEERMYSDRIGQLIAHECEAELRELAAYMGSLLRLGGADAEHNPLRASIIGAAAYRAIEAASEQADVRKLLAREFGTTLAKAMPVCYQTIIRDLQARGIKPEALTVRGVDGPGNRLPGVHSGYAGLGSTRSQNGDLGTTPGERDFGVTSPYPRSGSGGHGIDGQVPRSTGYGTGSGVPPGSFGGHPSSRGGATSSLGPHSGYSSRSGPTSRPGLATGHIASQQADAQLMALLRRLTAIASRPGELDPTPHTGAGTGPGIGPFLGT
ncbi:MAG TPA: DUF1631 family protein, partial [Burkholderiaceae bacterium]|nr:DUF1631 family protein [Burkholderiaceae bacterium]